MELKEVYISLVKLTSDGEIDYIILDGEPLKQKDYLAGQKIKFDISNLPEPGVYSVEIGAVVKMGEIVMRKLWFYHAGWSK